MKAKKRAYLELHLAIFLWGFTAILGKLILLESMALVWWRIAFTCLSFLFFRAVWKEIPKYSRSLLLKMVGIGVLIAAHWVCFFASINYSNVSICLITMATTSFFTALIEPFVMKKRHNGKEIFMGLLVILGMFLVVNFIPSDKVLGVYLGLASAFLAALFSIFNKKIIDEEVHLNMIATTFVELASGLVFLSILFPFATQWLGETPFMPQGINDIIYILILALVCTTFAHVLGMRALRHLSAFSANLAVNLEPVYGIILAWILFQENEEVGKNFYWGAGIILLVVFLHPLITKKKKGEISEVV